MGGKHGSRIVCKLDYAESNGKRNDITKCREKTVAHPDVQHLIEIEGVIRQPIIFQVCVPSQKTHSYYRVHGFTRNPETNVSFVLEPPNQQKIELVQEKVLDGAVAQCLSSLF